MLQERVQRLLEGILQREAWTDRSYECDSRHEAASDQGRSEGGGANGAAKRCGCGVLGWVGVLCSHREPGALTLVLTERWEGSQGPHGPSPHPKTPCLTPTHCRQDLPCQDSWSAQTLLLLSDAPSLRPCSRFCFSEDRRFRQISISRLFFLCCLI